MKARILYFRSSQVDQVGYSDIYRASTPFPGELLVSAVRVFPSRVGPAGTIVPHGFFEPPSEPAELREGLFRPQPLAVQQFSSSPAIAPGELIFGQSRLYPWPPKLLPFL